MEKGKKGISKHSVADLFNSFPDNPSFIDLEERQAFKKITWEKKAMHVISIFSYSHNFIFSMFDFQKMLSLWMSQGPYYQVKCLTLRC